MQAAVVKARGQVPSTKDLETLFKSSPGLWNSGYLVLAAIQGAPPADRNAANMVINLTRGGNAGQILIVSRYPLDDTRVNQLGNRLRAMSASFAKTSGLEVAVGGVAGSQWDTANATIDKLPAVLIAEVVVVALLLMLMLRAILIPAAATLCAALTTAAGFGVMQLLFGGSNPPLGGSGTWYPVAVVEVLAAIYGATLVYIVVLITRARDHYVASGDARGSLVHGIRSTIAATTGMATITIAVLIPFTFTGFVPIRMIAVAAALGVGLVAYIVVPVLLPAAMSLLGRAGWWPTHGPQPVEPAAAPEPAAPRPPRWSPRPHMPHRGARPAHQ
jgi:RND superfamily putative drug exporter